MAKTDPAAKLKKLLRASTLVLSVPPYVPRLNSPDATQHIGAKSPKMDLGLPLSELISGHAKEDEINRLFSKSGEAHPLNRPHLWSRLAILLGKNLKVARVPKNVGFILYDVSKAGVVFERVYDPTPPIEDEF